MPEPEHPPIDTDWPDQPLTPAWLEAVGFARLPTLPGAAPSPENWRRPVTDRASLWLNVLNSETWDLWLVADHGSRQHVFVRYLQTQGQLRALYRAITDREID